MFIVLAGRGGRNGVLRSPKLGTTAATLKLWVGAGVDPATLPQHVALHRPGQEEAKAASPTMSSQVGTLFHVPGVKQ